MHIAGWFLYMHVNKENGNKYVGITSQDPPEKRWLNGKGYSKSVLFNKAIQKYGWDGFEHKILLRNLGESEAKCLEKYLISILGTNDKVHGYNITSGGDGSSGLHHSEESRRKMSAAKSGENHPNFGKHMSKETRDRIARRLIGNKNFKGHTHTDETIRKVAEAKFKPVLMMDENANILKRFDSAKCAESETGISRKNISLCCHEKRKHAGGYSWKFA